MIPDVIPHSNTRWPRGLKYTVAVAADPVSQKAHDERLVPLTGTREEWYDPTVEVDLLDSLMETTLAVEGVRTLITPIEFADEYGLLGYSKLHQWEGLPAPEMGDYPLSLLAAEDPELRRQLADPRAPAHIELDTGEPIYWFKAHAQTVRMAHDLIVYLKLKDERRLRDLIEILSRGSYAALDGLSDQGAFGWARDYAGRDLLGAVNESIMGLINPNIHGLQHKLHVDSFGRLQYSLTFSALIQVIYWQLVARLNNDRMPRFCLRCGKPFFPADPRQRYCPKPLGKSRSVCGARAVKDTFKERWPGGKSENSSNEKHRRRSTPPKRRKHH